MIKIQVEKSCLAVVSRLILPCFYKRTAQEVIKYSEWAKFSCGPRESFVPLERKVLTVPPYVFFKVINCVLLKKIMLLSYTTSYTESGFINFISKSKWSENGLRARPFSISTECRNSVKEGPQ